MRRTLTAFVLSACVGMLAVSGAALAQQSAPAFDGKKFFEELQSRGFKSEGAFDGKKFFDDLQSRGYSSSNKLDGKKFFEELSSRGYKGPAEFDAKKFFEEQTKIGGYNMPPMVDMTH